MKQRVYEVEFNGRRLRFVSIDRRSTTLFIPLDDLAAALQSSLSTCGRRSWQTVLERRLTFNADPSARQRAFLEGRIVPTVSSGFVMMLCHSLGRLIEQNPALAPAAAEFAEFRRHLYKSFGAARRHIAYPERESHCHTGPGQA